MNKILIMVALCLSVQPASAFVVISNAGKPAKWEGNLVRYEFYSVPSSFKSAIRRSFDSWTEVSGVDLRFIEDETTGDAGSRDGKNTVAWINSGWSNLSFSPPPNALAVTLSSFDAGSGEIVDADIFFNADNFDWAVIESEDDEDKVDVQNIATHEIGHMIGLDHSSVSFFETNEELFEATMFYASGAGETSRREPQADDQKGVRSLYAEKETSAPIIEEVEEIERSGSMRTYRVRGSNFSELTSFVLTANTTSIYDAVSRYRTIISSTEAEVQISTFGFYVDEGELIAFNHPGQLSTFFVNVDNGATGANSTNSGGGGGCSMSADAQAKPGLIWFLLLGAVFYFARARQWVRVRSRPDVNKH